MCFLTKLQNLVHVQVFLEVHRGLEEVYNELLLINWNGEDRAQLQRAYTLSVLHTFSYDKVELSVVDYTTLLLMKALLFARTLPQAPP